MIPRFFFKTHSIWIYALTSCSGFVLPCHYNSLFSRAVQTEKRMTSVWWVVPRVVKYFIIFRPLQDSYVSKQMSSPQLNQVQVILVCIHHCIHSPTPPATFPWHSNIKADRSQISTKFATKATYTPNLQTMVLSIEFTVILAALE
jgi:hypothetical protein